MQRFPMTPAGKKRLEAELERLRTVERPAIVVAIEEARAHGDLKENAEYHAAKDRQGQIEARIREFETKVGLAEVIDPTSLSGDRVRFGATVRLLDLDNDDEITYSIVGEDEADFRSGLISYQSPIARAVLGREEGDEVEVITGNGTRNLEIVEVQYKDIVLPEKR
ncbi:MAG: transcription elongation factor GreA [Deltaproteobacteria bacterium]|nr:MAG: transcription elongation factor GreA [Deltaproteobacteria bacterium]